MKTTDTRYCQRCKKQTEVEYRNIVSEYCKVCGKDYDIKDLNSIN